MTEVINYQNIYKDIIFKIFQEKNIITPEDFIENISKYIDNNNNNNNNINKDNLILYKIAEQFNIIKINNKWTWKWIL
tara:strand:+ start:657 stop:890 length:234 start_codon:yes stop_codon:yes gene_type:complete